MLEERPQAMSLKFSSALFVYLQYNQNYLFMRQRLSNVKFYGLRSQFFPTFLLKLVSLIYRSWPTTLDSSFSQYSFHAASDFRFDPTLKLLLIFLHSTSIVIDPLPTLTNNPFHLPPLTNSSVITAEKGRFKTFHTNWKLIFEMLLLLLRLLNEFILLRENVGWVII